MDFEVLIIGTDINAYYMARCYHEAYGRKANLIGKQAMAFTSLSNIINLKIEPNLWDDNIFKKTLEEFTLQHKNKKILLIGTNDTYVRLIIENKEFLSKYFVFNYVDLEMLDNLLIKDKFYTVFANSGLDMPKTFIYSCTERPLIPDEFMYPLILKPGNSVMYYKCEFPGKSKVYKIKSRDELLQTVKTIEDSGYVDNLIIQEFIPGDDSALYDSMFYCSKNKKAQIMTFAQIGLQEQTNTGVGNCTVLVNGFDEHGYKEEIVYKLKDFMESIGYQGFAEFDMKYDSRDGKYKVLEINPRQSRSGYYLAACGHNLVKSLVDDLIYDEDKPLILIKDKMLLTFVPKSVIRKYVESDALKKQINKLIKQGKIVDPLYYKKDLPIKRRIYLFLRGINYKKKYKKYKW
jgi:D-aspartate ligase